MKANPRRRARILSLGLGSLVLLAGCDSMNHTDKGLLAGGVLGGAAGTVIGGLTGHPGAGAAIGAAGGALTGAVVGNAADKSERKAEQQAAYAAQHPPLSITDVVQMVHNHTSDEVIITQIRTTGSCYSLRPEDITYLKQMGVSDRVVMEMQSHRPGSVVAVRPRPAVYVVEPPPPPIGIGVGFGYGWGHRHCW